MEDILYKHLSQNIKQLRKNNNMTQNDLAKKLYKSTSAIKKYESGAVNIPLQVINQLCLIFNVDLFELLSSDATEYLLNYYYDWLDILDINLTQVEIEDFYKRFSSIVNNYLPPSYSDMLSEDIISEILIEDGLLAENSTVDINSLDKKTNLLISIIDYAMLLPINNLNDILFNLLGDFPKEFIYLTLTLDEIFTNNFFIRFLYACSDNNSLTSYDIKNFKKKLLSNYIQKYSIKNKKNTINQIKEINIDNYQNFKSNKDDFLQTISIDMNTFDKLPVSSQEEIFMKYSDVPLQFLKLYKFLNKLNDEELKEEYMALHKEITNHYIAISKEYIEKNNKLLKNTIKKLEAQQAAKLTEELIKIKSAFDEIIHAARSAIDYNNSLIITIREYINDETIIIKDKNIKDKLIEFITNSLNHNTGNISDLDKIIEVLNGNQEE